MSGDYSRIDFEPKQHDLGVLLQQGRPLSDADWNALTMQLRRRIHVGALDTFDVAVVPAQTPHAFEVNFAGSNLTIPPGRIYVDGLLAENHGRGPRAWEPHAEQEVGTEPVFYAPPTTDPTAGQPYYPNPPAFPTSGRHLVYLDVWTREVDHLMRDGLIEKAVGVDSTTRLQTVWQVKILPEVGAGVDCSTPLDAIPGWLPAHAPSAGRLTTGTSVVPGQPDPCLIPPTGGYKGLENQLYRIEIHKGGPLGTATFKWSRDNASVATRVTHIPALDQLTVESIGKDSVLRFSDGDWIEITDDWRELHNLPGELRRIKVGNGVDDRTRTILLQTPLPAGLFPTDAQHRTDPGRHTRIKRWDQRGQVRDQNGNVLQDLDAASSTGEITVPAGAGVSVLLEHDIVATFSLDPAGGEFKSGDCWMFWARSTDATIEELHDAPPRAIHHHYAKLAVIELPSTVIPCRVHWPPPFGDDCACTVCVTPEQHAAGSPSIQDAIDEVVNREGGTICLDAGRYELRAPLRIVNAASLRIVGKGQATEIVSDGAVFETIEQSKDVALERFSAVTRGDAAPSAIVLRNLAKISIEDLRIEARSTAAIAFAEALADVSIRGNRIEARNGIVSDAAGSSTGLADLRIEDNEFACGETAIALQSITVHMSVSRIAGNRAVECRKAGFTLTGATAPGFGIEITGNTLHVLGDAIQIGLDGARIAGNDLVMLKPLPASAGIRLVRALSGVDGMDGCQIVGNRIFGFPLGIEIETPLATTVIERNQIERVEVGVHTDKAMPIRDLSIRGNQLTDLSDAALQLETFPMTDFGARISVNDNQIEARTRRSSVLILCREGDCSFNDNQCLHFEADDVPCVRLIAHTVIVSSNRIAGRHRFSMLLEPTAPQNFTALGNVTAGQIHVGSIGAGLPAPWNVLNRVNVV